MQDMLCYLIARDAMHQQQWLAVIDEIGAEATLPIPDSFDRCKEATEFSYMCPTAFPSRLMAAATNSALKSPANNEALRRPRTGMPAL